jgi:glycosyltransferase involved in cell wall biosynthesis
MGDTLRSRSNSHLDNIVEINNFVLDDSEGYEGSMPPEFLQNADRFRVLFAGNIGRMQGVEYLVRAAINLDGSYDVCFHIVGDGVMKAEIEEIAAPVLNRRIFLHDHQPISVVKRMIAEADLCIVSLGRDVFRVAYPSKTMTTLSAGGVILACVEKESELSRLVLEENLGYVVEPGDHKAIADAIVEATGSAGQLGDARLRARHAAAALFGMEPILEKWSQLLDSLETTSNTETEKFRQ